MNPSVLVFDSGVGGLSILQHIRQRTPALSLHYFMDSAAFPYGVKEDDVLIERVVSVCQSAADELQPQMLVIACNTASTLTLPALRQRLSIPVVGVVPAIKTAACRSGGGHIGLLATPATVNRGYTDKLIENFAAHCQVRRFGSAELVCWAEEYLLSGEVSEQLFVHLQSWLQEPEPLTHVVLGCTHFPLLRQQLEKLWPDVEWIDSGEAIARRVASLLSEDGFSPQQAELNCFWTSRQQQPDGALRFLRQLGEVSRQGCLGPDFIIQDTESV